MSAPIIIVVASPIAFTVVTVVLSKFTVNESVVTLVVGFSPNLISSLTTRLLLIVVVPIKSPMLMFAAPPAKLTVLALSLTRLNSLAVVVKSPPSTAMSSSKVTSPSTVPPVILFR